jgi:hypothetical protein
MLLLGVGLQIADEVVLAIRVPQKCRRYVDDLPHISSRAGEIISSSSGWRRSTS